MNIEKIQSQLQRVPDNALIGYVQNPEGQVPSYLALAELARRKEIRKSAAPQAQAPAQSVAEQAVAEAGPGIAGIPLQDPTMFSEQSMAAGGIVAFDDGGTVAYNRALQGSFLGRENLGNAMDLVDQYAPNIKNLVKQAGGYFVDAVSGLRWVRNPYTGELTRASDVVEAPNAGKYADMGPMGNAQVSPTSLGLANIPAPLSTIPSSTSMIPKQNLGNTGAAPVAEARVVRDAQNKPDGGSPMRGYKPTDFSVPDVQATNIPSADARFDALKRPEISAEQHMARLKTLIGENEGLAALKGKLTSMEEKAAREEEQAPWMALAKAGFAMAGGKSQNALQNIAEGAGVGISELAAGKERLAAKEEKRFALQTQMAQAERAEQVAAATHGINSEQADRARNDALGLAKTKAGLDIDIANTTNKLKADEANAKNKLEAKQLGITEKHYNDWYTVSLKSAEKSLQGIEKQGMQQQTAILNNLLDEANARVKALAGDFTATPQEKIDAKARLEAIQSRLMNITGVEYTGAAADPYAGFSKIPN
jgi:hypothetical protein